jgi:hypothetical protein
MGEPKNTLKKNGPSRRSPHSNNKIANPCRNNNQHIEYNHCVKTAHYLQSGTEGIFGLTNIHSQAKGLRHK